MNMQSADMRGLAGRQDVHGEPTRQIWIDLARSIALVLVVVGHTERGLVAAGLMSIASAQDFDRVVYSFHIPLFFLISGLLFAQSIQRRPFLLSWKSRTFRLVQPCLIWSIALLGLIVLAASQANTPVSAQDALTGILLLPLQPVSIFWFLYTLLICMVVSGLAVEFARLRPLTLLLLSSVLHLAYLLWFSDSQTGVGLQFVRFGEHQLYFSLGFFLARFDAGDPAGFVAGLGYKWREPRAIGAFALAMAACFLVAATLLVVLDLSYHSAVGTLAALSASAVVLSGCYLATNVGKWAVPAAILTISRETLAIFCMHVPFIAGTRMVMARLGVDDISVLLVAGTVMGLCGPLLALRLMDGFGLAALAGFGGERRTQTTAGRL